MNIELNLEEIDLLREMIDKYMNELKEAAEKADLFEVKEEMQREEAALINIERKLQGAELDESRR